MFFEGDRCATYLTPAALTCRRRSRAALSQRRSVAGTEIDVGQIAFPERCADELRTCEARAPRNSLDARTGRTCEHPEIGTGEVRLVEAGFLEPDTREIGALELRAGLSTRIHRYRLSGPAQPVRQIWRCSRLEHFQSRLRDLGHLVVDGVVVGREVHR